jgi:hypothetical protein
VVAVYEALGSRMKAPTHEQLLQNLDNMVEAGWVRAYDLEGPLKPKLNWPEIGFYPCSVEQR